MHWLEQEEIERLKELARKAELPVDELLRRWLRWRFDYGYVFPPSVDEESSNEVCVHLMVTMPVEHLETFLRAYPSLVDLSSDLANDRVHKSVGEILKRLGLAPKEGQ